MEPLTEAEEAEVPREPHNPVCPVGSCSYCDCARLLATLDALRARVGAATELFKLIRIETGVEEPIDVANLVWIVRQMRERLATAEAERDAAQARVSWAFGNVALSHEAECKCPVCAIAKLDIAEADIARLTAERDAARGERDEAREIVAKANNSVFGSYGYFTHASGVTLAEQIEEVKATSNKYWRDLATAQAALTEVTIDRDEWRVQHENLLAMFNQANEERGEYIKKFRWAESEVKRLWDALQPDGPSCGHVQTVVSCAIARLTEAHAALGEARAEWSKALAYREDATSDAFRRGQETNREATLKAVRSWDITRAGGTAGLIAIIRNLPILDAEVGDE